MVNRDEIMNVFGYVRVSTENQLENYSIDEQIERIHSFCKAKGWTLIKIYTDGGYSGGNVNRPALQQMLEAVRKHDADAVVVYKLDRLSRSQKDTLVLIEDAFLKNGVDFVSINENFDSSTPFGRAMIGILSVFAQLEKDQITERFTMGRLGRCKAGYFHGGGNIPKGYDYVNGDLMINPFEAIQIREVFNLFLCGNSINAVGRIMATNYDGNWSATKISVILQNTLYIGKVKFAGMEFQGNHEPIVSEEIFYEANRLFKSNRRQEQKSVSQKSPFRAGYVLSGLIYCKNCGAKYSANHGYYKCYSRSKSSKKFIKDPNCKNPNWRIQELDCIVKNSIAILVGGMGLDKIIHSVENKNENILDCDKIKNRLLEIDHQISRLIDLYQIADAPDEQLKKRIETLSFEKQRLCKEINQLHNKSKEDALQLCKKKQSHFASNLDSCETEMSRLLVSSLVDHILIGEDTLEVFWKI